MPYPSYRFKSTASADYYIQDLSASRTIYIKLPVTGNPTIHEGELVATGELSNTLYDTVCGEIETYLRIGTKPPHSPS